MQPFHLGEDKIKRYKQWGDWIQDAENKITFFKVMTNKQQVVFIRSCARAELSGFWTKEARIRFVNIASDGGPSRPHIPEDPGGEQEGFTKAGPQGPDHH